MVTSYDLCYISSAIIKKKEALTTLKTVKDDFNSVVNLLLVKTPHHNEGDFDVNDELKSIVDEGVVMEL